MGVWRVLSQHELGDLLYASAQQGGKVQQELILLGLMGIMAVTVAAGLLARRATGGHDPCRTDRPPHSP